MRILWISNVMFPEVCSALGVAAPVVGGWMQSGAEALLAEADDVVLAVASLYGGNELKTIKGRRIAYYLVPMGRGDQHYDAMKVEAFSRVVSDFRPDLVHIHGSEYPHSLAAAKGCGRVPFVVSIQGLVSRYYYYYYGGIRECEVHRMATVRDLLRRDRAEDQYHRMQVRGDYEEQLLSMARHVIGRTSWDKSSVWAINPAAHYHFCNETLRSAFYAARWQLHDCEQHSIFLSQGHYPLKGAHRLVEALPLVLRHYPDTRVYVAGNDFLDASWYRRNGYAAYLKRLIEKNQLADHICFVGKLDEQQMAGRYARSHVFVCPSSIENSPNSVGEAQLVGTPVVASYVGGTMDMVTDGETGFLYRFEETPLLAMRICELFASPALCCELSEKERDAARKRHDGQANARQLLSIYHDILSNDTTTL